MSDTFYSADFLQSLPDVLKNDETTKALAQVAADELHLLAVQTLLEIIYANIDNVPEAVLDVMARDFKVDWYDFDYSVEEKRLTIKNSWNVHRKLGTKYAVETAISAIYPKTKVEEWWEYGGQPYYFKLILDATYEGVNPEKHRRVLDRVQYYKNLRSVLEGIEYVINADGAASAYVGAATIGCYTMIGVVCKAYGIESIS